MTDDELDELFGVSKESPGIGENETATASKTIDADAVPVTRTCPTCGATFTKDTDKRALSACRLHHIRKHPDVPLPESLTGPGSNGDSGPRLRGLTAAVHGTGNLPPGCSTIKQSVSSLRGVLIDAVTQRHGTVSDPMRLLIQTALRWETYAELCRKWLNEKYNALSLDKKMELGSQIATASERRDKALEALGIARLESTHRRHIDLVRGARAWGRAAG